MNRHALYAGQKVDALGHIDEAIAAVRKCIDVEPSAGPLLVGAYRALAALGELREAIDGMPNMREDPRA